MVEALVWESKQLIPIQLIVVLLVLVTVLVVKLPSVWAKVEAIVDFLSLVEVKKKPFDVVWDVPNDDVNFFNGVFAEVVLFQFNDVSDDVNDCNDVINVVVFAGWFEVVLNEMLDEMLVEMLDEMLVEMLAVELDEVYGVVSVAEEVLCIEVDCVVNVVDKIHDGIVELVEVDCVVNVVVFEVAGTLVELTRVYGVVDIIEGVFNEEVELTDAVVVVFVKILDEEVVLFVVDCVVIVVDVVVVVVL